MPGPAPEGVGGHEKTDALRRLHIDRVLARLKLPVGALQFAPQPVQVHGMGHHGVVVQNHAHPLVVPEMYRRGLAEFQPVERPGVAFHVAGQVQLDLAPGSARIERPAKGVQVGIGQHPPAVVAQANARIVEVGARRVHAHVRARAVFGFGVAHTHRRRPCHSRAVGHDVSAVIHGHATVGTVIHRPHHVAHGERFGLVERRHRGGHAGARRQRAAGETRAIHRLGENRVGLVAGRHDHIVGFGDAEADFVHRRRFDVLAVGLNHRHLESRDAHVEKGHRTGVDKAQPHPLARAEQPGPVVRRRGAVHQVGVGVTGNVGEIGRAHAHLVPHLALVERGRQPHAAHVTEKIHRRGLVEIVVIALHLELGVDVMRIFIRPVGQLHHVVASGANRIAPGRVNDNGAVHAGLFLHAGMRVVPVGAGLPHLEAVDKGLARGNALEADARHAIHLVRQQDAVPVDGGVHGQMVRDPQCHRIARAPAQGRRRDRAVDGGGQTRTAGVVDRGCRHRQVKFSAAEHRRGPGGSAGCRLRKHRPAPGRRAQQQAARNQVAEKLPARQIRQAGRTRVHGFPRKTTSCRHVTLPL